MTCTTCGATLVEGAAFCSRCGKAAEIVAGTPPPVVRRPTGVTLLAIYDIAAAVFTLALALSLGAFGGERGGIGFAIFAGIVASFGVLRLAAGWGMLLGAGWARMLHFVLSGLSILNLPIGTGVAVASFVYLTRPAIKLWFAKKNPSTWSAEEIAAWNRAGVGSMSGAVIAAVVGGVLLASVPVFGIVAAIAIPNFLNAVDRGKQKRTMADLQSIGVAIESYAVDHDAYPVLDVDSVPVGALAPFLEPYLDAIPRQDGWGHEIVVRSDGREYELWSTGKDGAPDVDREPGTTSSFGSDIVFSNGTFVRYPEGVQR